MQMRIRHLGTIAAFSLVNFWNTQAGDILRGGAAANAKAAPGNAAATAAATEQARASAKDALARTASAVQSVQAMQNAARNAVRNGPNNLGADPNRPGFQLPNVPNGLAPGGLQISGAPVGATAPRQSTAGGMTKVTVKQTAQQALLNWSSFNIGQNTNLHFDQSAGGANVGQWIAFNRVADPSGSPSQILGSITAPGQVYVINQNGIIFGGGSQVNVHTLVVSSLPINDNLITRGLLNNPDSQFLFSALALPAGKKGTPAFTPPAPLTANKRLGDVTVQAGAMLTSPTSADHVGGRIALIGPNVSNAGTISTPDGQTILAAGLQVGLDAHKSADPSLRGLDVYIGAVVDPAFPKIRYAGTATNSGLIDAPRANVTIAGKTVRQLGVINSSTSVSLNGRIDLLANYDAVSNINYDAAITANGPPYLSKQTGHVELGKGSVMQILPEWSSTDKVVGTKLALPSQVNITGKTVHMASGAMILAPNANVSVSAGVWDFIDSLSAPKSNFVYSKGQIYLDPGASINVAGTTDAVAPLSQNIVTVQLRGAELADSPLQRLGPLRGVDLTIDLRKTGVYNGVTWYGTPLADASGYLGLIQRTVSELTTAGGTVKLNAGNSVVVQNGADINVSGGWINYQGGTIKTTRVLSNGHIFDISEATPDRVYDGIYDGKFTVNHPKWGQSFTYVNPFILGEHYEPGYIHGVDGGSLAITSPAMALDGDFFGSTVNGPRQRTVLAKASALELSFTGQKKTTPYDVYSPTPPDVLFESGHLAAADPFALKSNGDPYPLRIDRRKLVLLSPDLFTEAGFGSIKVDNPDGNIYIPEGVSLIAPASGSLTLAGANINIDGDVRAPGGGVSLTAYNISPSKAAELRFLGSLVAPKPNLDRGNVNIGSGSTVSTAGLIVDDRLSSPNPLGLPLVTNGGSINIKSYNANLAAGSTLDVSGGLAMNAFGKVTYGNGGSISILTGQDPSVPGVIGGTLKLGSTLKGYAGITARGGSLTLQALLIQIGGRASYPGTFLIQPEFFNQGGFSSFTLNGIGAATDDGDVFIPGLSIAPHTIIDPQVRSLLALPHPDGTAELGLTTVLYPESMRAPVNLSFGSLRITDEFSSSLLVRGDLVLGEGAIIRTNAKGSVSLKADTISVLGSIFAPGGSIDVAGANSFPINGTPTEPLPTVYLGPRSVLSTAGMVVLTPDAYGRRVGSVLPGGLITVSGNIVGVRGSTIDVSGASGVLDFHPNYLGLQTNPLVPLNSGVNAPLYSLMSLPKRIDSNGGTIVLKGGQEMFIDSTLKGFAGGPTALGGNLIVSSGRFYLPGQVATPLDPTLEVTQGSPTIPTGQAGIGKPVLGLNGQPLPGMGYFAANTFLRGGFDSLTLGGTVKFSGPVNIPARNSLIVGTSGVIYADSDVNLSAPYVALGQAFQSPFLAESPTFAFPNIPDSEKANYLPTFGPGKLTVRAEHIDIGNLILKGIGRAELMADGGDIRGNGTLNIAGSLYLRAAQIYPAAATTFTIGAYDKNIEVLASTLGSTTVTLVHADLPPGFGVGTPFLGSTVASISGDVVTLASGADRTIVNAPVVFDPGSGTVTIAGSGTRSLPLEAGGTLNIFGSVINQGGVLRAPLGQIHLGWDGSGDAPKDPITGLPVPVTQKLNLLPGSITSVSGVDPITGRPVIFPYGILLNGTSWIDPAGNDITNIGPPQKLITLGGAKVNTMTGSVIDISGGGDLYAYRWIKGIGGSKDVLSSSTSFAVIPGYGSAFSPYGAFNSSLLATNLNGDPGYVNSSLKPGDQIYLGGSDALRAGVYTLLPARFALLPGAVLVTPQSGAPIGTFKNPDGSSYVSGYRFNSLNGQRDLNENYSRFEVAPSEVVRARSEYEDYFANAFFTQEATKRDARVPRLPIDAGQLVFSATQAMAIRGSVISNTPPGGRGSLIDISSPVDIVIVGGGKKAPAGSLSLDAGQLSAFGAESLLIGGIRTFTPDGISVAVNTNNLTVNNAGTPLTGADIIMVSNDSMTLAPGAQILQTKQQSGSADTVYIGNDDIPGSGDGLLIRVSSDPTAKVIRQGVSSSTIPHMVIGAGATVSGGSVTLDSTFGTSLSSTAKILGQTINLNSGQISLALNQPGVLQPTEGLVLTGAVLKNLQSATSLSLLSYSSIDTYGTGVVGSAGLQNLSLHAAQIRGFNTGGGAVRFAAQQLLLDNSPGRNALGVIAPASGQLIFDAGTIRLGGNDVRIDQYSSVVMNAAGGVVNQGAGTLSVAGDLTINTPVMTGSAGSSKNITATGDLELKAVPGSVPTVFGGLGAKLNLTGSSVRQSTEIAMPSGLITLHGTLGDVIVSGNINVGGTAQVFQDMIKYTFGGQVKLISDQGEVAINNGSTVNVSANPGAGDAGSLIISAPQGSFSLDGTVSGRGGNGGRNGVFSLDAATVSGINGLNQLLNTTGFTDTRSFRVRTGNVSLGGTINAQNFRLSADAGSITLTGTINASGVNGGTVILDAFENLTLASGSLINASGQQFNSAGKGGQVYLSTRGANGGVLDLQTGSTINLSVSSNTASSAALGKFTGTLHLRAPQNAGATDLAMNPINSTIIGASSITAEGFKVFDLTDFGGAITTAVQNSILANGEAFLGSAGNTTTGYTDMETRLLANNAGLTSKFVLMPGAEIINSAAPAPLNLNLSTVGSTLSFNALGGTILFPSGTPGNNLITSNTSATITSATGVVTTLAANTPTSIPAGSSVTFASTANLTFASGAGGAIPLILSPGSTYTTGLTGASSTISTVGSSVTLNSTTTSFISLAAGSQVTFPTGTVGTNRIRSNVAGTITSPSGVVTNFAANVSTAVPAGSRVSLNAAGNIIYASGTGGAIPITLASGSFTTNGRVSVTPPSGDLTLGTLASTATSDWNLATFRFGPKSAPGHLTLRATGNITMFNALSDGFDTAAYNSQVLTINPLLPTNTQSYSYTLTAGADLTAADPLQVQSLAVLGASAGSLQLGKNGGNNFATTPGLNATTISAINNRFQVIRTGTGNIDIATGRDVQLLNAFATIYTAGVSVADPTMGGTFDLPTTDLIGLQDRLGAVQQPVAYPAQYTLGGGNIAINAQGDIKHMTRDVNGNLIDDSSRQLPNNWLYRRGAVDANGNFAVSAVGEIASTTWWVDFSNFFEGVGALGGGNVSLFAGGDVKNVDAVIPTNARAPKGRASTANLTELGGGDLTIVAGGDINGGAYYIERGNGKLTAGGSVLTNSTRSPYLPTNANSGAEFADTYLPTTLFLGKGGFDVNARGSLTLGPVANVFMLPGGYNNTYWYKTYFSTYDANSFVSATSLTGQLNFRQTTTLPGENAPTSILLAYIKQVQLLPTTGSIANFQPFLRLNETRSDSFATAVSLMPGTVRGTAFSGNVNLIGDLTMSPSAKGTIELMARGAINGLQKNGFSNLGISSNPNQVVWGTSTINLSDADPRALPGVNSPFAFQSVLGSNYQIAPIARESGTRFLEFVDQQFRETGSTQDVLQVKQALHSPTILHKDDRTPIRLYAGEGDVADITLFSPKSARVIAGRDVTDIAIYIQNTSDKDVSLVSAGRDITAYNNNSPLREAAQVTGNVLQAVDRVSKAGDLQISGPGTFEILAGRHVDLGTGESNADGTGTGITSIGNGRNPSLTFGGANVIVGAGLGSSAGLESDSMDFDGFIASYVTAENLTKYQPELVTSFPDLGTGNFASLPKEMQHRIALEVFYRILRDAGRNHNVPGDPGFGNYDMGTAAIASLFSKGTYEGDISTRARDIRTKSGGNISIFAPGGKLTLATSVIGEPLAPPGIITEGGGNISIFTDGNVDLGISRIFTLRGGNEIIWSSNGDIAAGSSSKTVQSAPPTRVIIDPQSGDVKTDLAGLATGGGIGVLNTVAGVEPGDVDLIAPMGTIDAGDAGIRSAGNLNVAASAILNASNIQVSGGTSGAPAAPSVSAPNIGGLAGAANAAGAATSTATQTGAPSKPAPPTTEEAPSLITVEVLGYGGGSDEDLDEEERKKREAEKLKEQEAQATQ